MKQQIIVLGAGIIGASTAYHLQKAGAQVTVLDAGLAQATQASFGWINASFYLDDDHFHLRNASIAAYRGLSDDLQLSIDWCGCLCFENSGAALYAQADDLKDKGYPVEIIDQKGFRKREPNVANAPEACLSFPTEAAAESERVAAQLIDAAIALGAQVRCGVTAQSFAITDGQVTGVQTDAGVFAADQIFSAVGTQTEALMQTLDVRIPLLERPAVMLRTKPTPKILNHILVSELGELRQLPDGSLLMPAAVGHQQDTTRQIIDVAADGQAAFKRLQAFLPDLSLVLDDLTLAYRPVPQDERPVVGPVMEGLYVACLHSGVTLAAILGQMMSEEILLGPSLTTSATLARYRPQRFAQ